jgi:hypothetical protein
MSETPTTDIVKWYTRARKFPQLIGRTPDGMKLWGGPYTITQACGFGLVLFVGLNTMSLWASFGFVGNFIVLGAVAAGVVFGLGRIPVGSRSPFSVTTGAWKAVASPQHGRLGGRPVRIRRPHRLQHRMLVQIDPVPAPAENPAPASEPTPAAEQTRRSRRRLLPARRPRPETPSPQPVAPEPVPASPQPHTPAPALTGIQALLAASAAGTSHRSEHS